MIIKRAYAEGSELPEILEPGTKTAAHVTPSPARTYIAGLEPNPQYTYVLVNAMGYSEFYGSNSNTDWYGYNPHLDFNGLLHAWDGIGQDNEADRMKGKAWPYGYPCYYGATCYAHHRNTDPQQLGFGDVVFVAPNSHMKRIELVMRVFNEEAKKKGHTNFLDRLRAGERVDVSMGAKVPFDLCVRPGTLVRSGDGWKPAESIQVGDSVLTHRGRLRRVTRTFRRQAEDALLCVRAKGVPVLEVTGTHPLLVVRQEQLRKCRGSAKGRQRRCTPVSGMCTFCGCEVILTPEWVDAKDLRVGDYLVAPREELGTARVDAHRARLLGYWLGDGHRVRQRTGKKSGPHRLMGYAFTVGHSEEMHLTRLWSCIQEVSPNEPSIHESGEGRAAYQVVVYDQETARWLCRLGADAEYNKRISEEVFSWEREALLELLGGWIDTDGSFDRDKGLVRISTVSRGLALDCQRILRLLGVPAAVTTAKHSTGYVPAEEHYYSVAITKHHVHRLELWTRAEKVAVVEACAQGTEVLVVGNSVLHPVFALRQSTYEGDVVNFSVEEDESYVAEGVSTHNCSICTDWAAVKTAWATFDPKRHAHPGIAILFYHKTVKPIRGLAVTKADYCFPRGTLISMASGEQLPIEDVAVGDYVLAHDGSYQRVAQLLPSSDPSPAVRVHAWGFASQLSTGNHPYLVHRNLRTGVAGGRAAQMCTEGLEWVPAEDLCSSDVVLCPVRQLTPNAEQAYAVDLGWLLGLYLAEGSPSYSAAVPYPCATKFSLHEKERPLVEQITRAARLLDPAAHCTVRPDNGEGLTVRLASRLVSEWLEHHGGRGSHTKSLHPAVFSQSAGFCRAVLAGWAQGDGSYDDNQDNLRVATSSERLGRQMQGLAASCGVLASLHLYERTSNFAFQRIWYVSFAGDAARAVQEQREQRVFSKQSKLFFWGRYLCTSVRSVEQADFLAEKYNFEVEGTHSYVAGGFAVHNCSHMREHRGKVLSTGQKVFVYNDFPRFFDISFVWIGADRTARAMWFLGPEGSGITPRQKPSIDVMALLATLLRSKTSAMLKDIEGGHVVEAVGSDADCSPTMGDAALTGMTQHFGAKSVLSTLAGLGIVAKPREFQAIVLSGLPNGPEMVARLAERSAVFDAHQPKIDDEFAVSAEDFLPELAEKTSVLMSSRSGFNPYLAGRLANKIAGLHPVTELKVASGPVLDDIAAKYNGYRLSLLEKSAELFPLAASADLNLMSEKTANWGRLLLGLGPVIHFVSSHLRQKSEEGKQLGAVGKFVADNPTFTTMATVGAALRAVMGIQAAGGLGAAAKTILSTATKLIK